MWQGIDNSWSREATQAYWEEAWKIVGKAIKRSHTFQKKVWATYT